MKSLSRKPRIETAAGVARSRIAECRFPMAEFLSAQFLRREDAVLISTHNLNHNLNRNLHFLIQKEIKITIKIMIMSKIRKDLRAREALNGREGLLARHRSQEWLRSFNKLPMSPSLSHNYSCCDAKTFYCQAIRLGVFNNYKGRQAERCVPCSK